MEASTKYPNAFDLISFVLINHARILQDHAAEEPWQWSGLPEQEIRTLLR